MHNNRSRKHKILQDTRLLLSFLLAFLPVSLIPTAASFQMQPISTSGTITYPAPPPANGNYLAYTGWETGTGIDDNRGLRWNWNLWGSTITRDTTFKYSGAASIRGTKTAPDYSGRLEFKFYPGGVEVYTSVWANIADIWTFTGAWEWNSMREQWLLGNLGIDVYGSTSNPYWYIHYCVGAGGYRSTSKWYYDIGENGLIGYKPWPGATVDYNPHGVPLGRWFRLETYRFRSSTNGIFKIWITDPQHPDPSKRDTRLLFGAENIFTSDDPSRTSSADLIFMPLKLYGMTGTVYWDDLYIYNYNAHGG